MTKIAILQLIFLRWFHAARKKKIYFLCNFGHLLVPAYWAHHKGFGLPSCFLHFCNFYQMVILLEFFFFTACKAGVIPEKKFKLFCKGGSPARIFLSNYPGCNASFLCYRKDWAKMPKENELFRVRFAGFIKRKFTETKQKIYF